MNSALCIVCSPLCGIQSSDCYKAPAAGYRNISGDLRNVGTNGYALCSSPFAADGSLANRAGFLNFNSGNVNPITNAYRCEAFPVRCVQHLREVAFYLCRKGPGRAETAANTRKTCPGTSLSAGIPASAPDFSSSVLKNVVRGTSVAILPIR